MTGVEKGEREQREGCHINTCTHAHLSEVESRSMHQIE
jgi:hypothetical protein